MTDAVIQPDLDRLQWISTRLHIVTKGGQRVLLKPNPVQLALHMALQQQRCRGLPARLRLLKFRQWGGCLSPSTRVLTPDLQWKQIGDLRIGDELVGTDEGSDGNGKGRGRKLRRCTVLDRWWTRKPAYRITLSSGVRLIASGDHRFLGRRRADGCPAWRRVRKAVRQGSRGSCPPGLAVGDPLRRVTLPWGASGYEDGWFGGLWDGEGSLVKRADSAGGIRANLSQAAGPVWERAKAYLTERGYHFSESWDTRTAGSKSRLGNKPVGRLHFTRTGEVFRLIGQTRPSRFGYTSWWEGRELPGKCSGEAWDVIVDIEPLPEQDLVDISTTTQTFLAEGYVSHNSTWLEAEGFYEVMKNPNWRAMAVSVDADSTDHIFGMTKIFEEDMPAAERLAKDATNRKEIRFAKPHRSQFIAQTAGKLSLGHSFTAQFLHCCLAEGTLVLGPGGQIRPIESFEAGDEIRTHTGQAAAVSFVSRKVRLCRRVVFRGLRNFPLVATPEHKVWTPQGWQELGTLGVGDVVGFPVAAVTGEVRRLPFAQPAAPRPQNGGAVEHVPSTIALTRSLGRVMGLYLAEGHIADRDVLPRFCRVTFSVHRDEVDWVLKWLRPLKGYYSSVHVEAASNSLTRFVHVYGKSFATFTHDLLGRVETKRGPVGWPRMPKDFLRGMVEGYLAGDGHFPKDRKNRLIRASSIRPAITLFLRDVIASLGLGWSGIEYRQGGLRRGRNEKDQYTLTVCGEAAIGIAKALGKPMLRRSRTPRGTARTPEIRDGYAWIPIQKIEEAGPQRVFDFEVDHPDHSYCTLQAAVSNSEISRWDNAETQMGGLQEIVPLRPGTTIVQETTANGQGGYFYDAWREDVKRRRRHPDDWTGYLPIFVGWYMFPDYAIEPRPGVVFTRDERALQRQFQLTEAQLMWRRMKLEEMNGDLALFNEQYPDTWEAAFQSSGNPVFSAEILGRQRLTLASSGLRRVVFDETSGSVEPVDTEEHRNVWWIRGAPHPDHDYAMGIDSMEGRLSDVNNPKSELDMDGITVLDRDSGDVVAIYQGRTDQRELARQAYRAAVWYNQAHVGPEMPASMVLLGYFKERGYPNLYNRSIHEDRLSDGESEVLGWRTTAITRKWLVDDFVVAAKEGGVRVVFGPLLEEMQSFVRNKSGRAEALPGEHDDLLFSAMIALQVHRRCPMSPRAYSSGFTGDIEESRGGRDINDLAYAGAVDDLSDLDDDEEDEDEWTE